MKENIELLNCGKYLASIAMDIWEYADKHFMNQPDKLDITNKECRQLIKWAELLIHKAKNDQI